MNIERRKRLCDYGSLSPSPRLLFPFALRALCDDSSLSPYALSVITVPFRPTSFRPTSSRPTPSRLRPLRDYSSRVQKPRFCARNARKRGLRRVKAHKNADFVLERGQNLGKVALSDTKTPILCSKAPKIGVLKGKSAQKPRFCARKPQK